jgi:hypothetical protein
VEKFPQELDALHAEVTGKPATPEKKPAKKQPAKKTATKKTARNG